MRKWLCVVAFCAVGLATAQVDDAWGTDYEDTWWSDEASAEQLGLVEDNKKGVDGSFEPSKELTDDDAVNDEAENNFEEDVVDEIKDLTAEEKADYGGNDQDDYQDQDVIDQEEEAQDGSPVEDNADYQNVLDEINEYFKQLDDPDTKNVDELNDYQVEDNRSKEENDSSAKPKDDTDNIAEDAKEILSEPNHASEENISVENEQSGEVRSLKNNVINDDNNTQENVNTYSTENQKVEDDAQSQLNEDENKSIETSEDKEKIKEKSTEIYNTEDLPQESDMKNVDKTGNKSTRNNNENDSNETFKSEVKEGKAVAIENKVINSGEDTVDKVYADLNADITKLLQTWDKLTDDEPVENDDNVQEYEEKNGKPFREDLVLAQRREEFENYDDGDEPEYSEEEESENTKIGKESNEAENKTPIEYQKDAFVYEENVNNENEKQEVNNENNLKSPTTTLEPKVPVVHKIIQVDDLTPEQYNDLMDQFSILHKDELNTQSDDFGQNVAPVHLTINAEQPIEITSPNYPNAFPSNNVVDWILEGEGTGIELNITDFEVRGPNGDFLLIKPGGLDDSGTEGLVFSYHLNEPRRYRFTDVNRMFIRFNAGIGLGFLRGFQMSVKMIWPPENKEPEPMPEPEPLLPAPPANITVSLGGMTVTEFSEIQDEFRRLVADMATMYVNAIGIDMGINTTQETAQVTRVSVCNIHWPDFENCVEVTFGVPLVYEDADEPPRLNRDDLVKMWETYVELDPFATRLRSLGIQVFPAPNDGRVLLGWLVLAAGVVISALMLAFAMWRFTCFQDYSRMHNYSDNDSLRDEKRNLDLYPTPHQTLPPLYSDDYKWADGKYENHDKVDMGGYSNRSYIRDELLDIDSDDDVIATRDRNASVGPRENYQV